MYPQNDFLLVLCTCPKGDTSDLITEKIINSNLAACVNKISNIKSTFIWENSLEKNDEDLLLIKSTDQNFVNLSDLIQKEHPYDCPEIIAIPIIAGNSSYLKWVKKQCSK